LLPQAIELPCNGGIHKGGFSESALKPLLWGEPPAGCVPAPQSSLANHHHILTAGAQPAGGVGGTRPAPAFPRRGKRERGDSNSSLPQANSYRDRAHRLCAHALVVASPLSVPPCFHTHSPWTRPKPRREPGARCHSVGPGLLSYVVDLRRPAFQLGGGSTSSTQSPGCRRRQSVASVGASEASQLASCPVHHSQAATAVGRSERRG
jgi:hypothetical protein